MESYTKAFAIKTRRGKIAWIAREHYLREDVPCMSELCKQCKQIVFTKLMNEKGVPSSSPNENTNTNTLLSSKASHYIIPSILVSVNYLELLEQIELNDIILCQTVINEVQDGFYSRSGVRLLQRLRALSRDSRRRIVSFNNEHFRETYTKALSKESRECRNLRAIFNLCEWYAKHLSGINIIFLAEEEEINSIEKIADKKSKITLLTVGEYISKYFSQSKILVDLYDSLFQVVSERNLTLKDETKSKEKDRESLYDRYYDDDLLQAMVKSGSVLAGTFHMNQNSSDSATLRVNTMSTSLSPFFFKEVLIIGKQNMNRAVHGDVVAVKLLPKNEWQSTNALEGEEGDINITGSSEIPSGVVVGVFQRNWRDYVGTIQIEDQKSQSDYVLIVPLDYKIPKIRIKTRQADKLMNDRVVVRIDEWNLSSNYPNGHFVRSLGEIGKLETELQALMLENDITINSWLSTIVNSLPSSNWKVPAEEFGYRRDIRKCHVMSIDPLGSQDIDDAISVNVLKNGKIEIGVHIADVSFFVKQNEPLDIEARHRSTTVYLPDRRFDMLPAILSEDLCSLRGGMERLAMSVIWTFDSDYNMVDTWFGRTIIHSSAELHYQLAQDILDGKKIPIPPSKRGSSVKGEGIENRLFNGITVEEIHDDLVILHKIFLHLHKKRMEMGALELESTEVRFQIDPNTHTPNTIVTKQELVVNKLVAEFMIQANKSVAEQIHRAYPSSALLRRHPFPNAHNFSSLVQCARSQGFIIDCESNKSLAESLSIAFNPKDPLVNTLLRMLATRAMSEAQYISSGSFSVVDYYHYGLALEFYTHFTSPIRRYADIIVHRQLWGSLQKPRLPPILDDQQVADLAVLINHRHRSSKQTQQEATELFQALYFMAFSPSNPLTPNLTSDAVVFSLRSKGFYAFIPQFGLKTMVYLKDKEGNLSPSTIMVGGQSVSLSGFTLAPDFSVLTLQSSKGDIAINIFDHVTVKIFVEQTRLHLPPVRLELVGLDQGNNQKRKNRNYHVSFAEKENNNNSMGSGKITTKDMARAIKDEETKIIESKQEQDSENRNSDFSQFRQPHSPSETLYNILEALKNNQFSDDLLDFEQTEDSNQSDKTIRVWAMNKKQKAEYKQKMEAVRRSFKMDEYNTNNEDDFDRDEILRKRQSVEERFSVQIGKVQRELHQAATRKHK